MSAASDPRLRPSPLRNPSVAVRAFGTSTQPIQFYLYQDVIEELTFAARYDDRTYGAILLGGFGLEGPAAFIEVTGFTGADWVTEPSKLYETLRPACDAWIHAADGEPIVGAFVSIPGCGGRVTEEAARLHYSLFNVPFQPLVMLDPSSGEISVSSRAPGDRLFNAAFRAVARVSTPPLNHAPRSGTPEPSSSEDE